MHHRPGKSGPDAGSRARALHHLSPARLAVGQPVRPPRSIHREPPPRHPEASGSGVSNQPHHHHHPPFICFFSFYFTHSNCSPGCRALSFPLRWRLVWTMAESEADTPSTPIEFESKYFEFDGVRLPPFCRGKMEEIANFSLRSSDIWIVTYPKSGKQGSASPSALCSLCLQVSSLLFYLLQRQLHLPPCDSQSFTL